jgi:zinc protease
MKMIFLACLFAAVELLTGPVLAQSSALPVLQDPYLAVEHQVLANGMNVYLAPSSEAKLVEVRLEVAVGTEAENKADIGVSHLLEHVLFRDKQLKEEMSYLQLIKEAGGEANGETQRRKTSFYASIPSSKGEWLVENFAKMILEPEISADYVKKEKGTVELERGRPSPIAEILHFDLLQYLNPKYLAKPNFFETEFKVKAVEEPTLTEEQLSTPQLTLEQVRRHYQKYYFAKNMKLFISGNFNRAKIIEQLQRKWAALPATAGEFLPAKPVAHPRLEGYKRVAVTNGTPHVELGTKLWDLTLQDQEIVHAYMNYLAHRLMKEVRNLKGQTYSAQDMVEAEDGYGYAYLQFETPAENFKENLEIARHYIDSQARAGGLTDNEIHEAIQLYAARYGLIGREASDLMGLAESKAWVTENYGKWSSPYQVLVDTKPEQFREILKRNFAPVRAYESVQRPPLLFRYDQILMQVFVAMGTFFVLRRLLTKSFQNDKVRWIRKLKFPPMKLLEGLALVVAYYGALHVGFVVELLKEKLHLEEAPVIISNYLSESLDTILFLSVVAGVISFLSRKLMVMNGYFVIKSLTYYSRKIPLGEIASVETARCNPFALSRWWRVKARFSFFNPKFWQPGLLINLKNGKSYFFGVANPLVVASELTGLLADEKNPRKHNPSADRECAA